MIFQGFINLIHITIVFILAYPYYMFLIFLSSKENRQWSLAPDGYHISTGLVLGTYQSKTNKMCYASELTSWGLASIRIYATPEGT